MDLSLKKWKKFSIDEFFSLSTSKDDYLLNLDDGSVEYVSSSAENNGVVAFVDATPSQSANTITVARNGSVGTTFYHFRPYCASSDDVRILTPSFKMDENIGLFLITIIQKAFEFCSYGRKLSKSDILKTEIMLPVDESGKPDWQFMEEYVKALRTQNTETTIANVDITKEEQFRNFFDPKNWKQFKITSLFDVSYGNKFDLNKMTFEDPSVNFVSRTAEDNGVSSKVDLIEKVPPFKAGSITVALGGSIGSSFLQDEPFYTGQNVAVITSKTPLTGLQKLFICQRISSESSKRFVAFGRELNIHIKRDFTIGLPIDKNGSPNWDLIEAFMKKLQYSEKV